MRSAYRIALVSLVVALPLLMAPTGGIPSRPRFTSVGVGVAAPAGTGGLTASGALTAFTTQPVATVLSAGKAALTSRASTIVSAADPDLTFTLPTGTWLVQALLLFDSTTTTVQGARYQINFGGTFDPARVVRCWNDRTTLLTTHNSGVQGMNADTLIPDISNSNVDVAYQSCIFRNTGSGTLQVRWAQEVSDVNPTILEAGSYLYALRLGS